MSRSTRCREARPRPSRRRRRRDAARRRRPRRRRAGAGAAAGPPAGITVDGEVKNFVPVTEAMLRNPDPADWLMIRRDYHASDYSPLNQITADNVKDLRLQWIWAMNEGGANQPAPLVHNGVIFLNNPGNVLQAIDGKTGELIWENRYGSNANGAAMRGISMYEDKLFVATSDAHLMAFDARTGKTVWDTTIGDRSKGNYGTSTRPARRQGQGDPGAGRLPDVSRREVLHQRVRRGHGQRALAVQHRRVEERSRQRHAGARCPTCSAPAANRGSRAATTRC